MARATSPIPDGFHTVTVHLSVNGAAAYSDFLQRAFGAVEIRRSPGPGGKLMHVQMKIGDSTIIFADDFSQEFGMPPLAEGRLPLHLHIYVPDVDALEIARTFEIRVMLMGRGFATVIRNRTSSKEDAVTGT
jgi:uncharacterized glyoxalase superfamily protein PhnB